MTDETVVEFVRAGIRQAKEGGYLLPQDVFLSASGFYQMHDAVRTCNQMEKQRLVGVYVGAYLAVK